MILCYFKLFPIIVEALYLKYNLEFHFWNEVYPQVTKLYFINAKSKPSQVLDHKLVDVLSECTLANLFFPNE